MVVTEKGERPWALLLRRIIAVFTATGTAGPGVQISVDAGIGQIGAAGLGPTAFETGEQVFGRYLRLVPTPLDEKLAPKGNE
jgi:hypothetical protein